MKRYYSVESYWGSSVSYGFSNDKIVRCFTSKASRDKYVNTSKNISCKEISACDATKYAANYSLTFNRTNAPRKFTCERWVIVAPDPDLQWDAIDGFIGTVSNNYGVPDNLIVDYLYR